MRAEMWPTSKLLRIRNEQLKRKERSSRIIAKATGRYLSQAPAIADSSTRD